MKEYYDRNALKEVTQKALKEVNKELLLVTSSALSATESAMVVCCNASKTTTLLRYYNALSCWRYHILLKIL